MPYIPMVSYPDEYYPDFKYHLDLTKRRISHRNDLKTNFLTPDFTIKMCVNDVEKLLDNKIRYTKVWNDYKIYTLGALQTYIEDAKSQGCGHVILSSNEFAAISKGKK